MTNLIEFDEDQLDGLERIRAQVKKGKTRVFDMSEMGSGKTPVQIQLIDDYKKAGGKKGTLVTGPISTLFAWITQIQAFAPHLTWKLVERSKSEELSSIGEGVYSGSLLDVMIQGHERYDVYLMFYQTLTIGFDNLVDSQLGSRKGPALKKELSDSFAEAMLEKIDRYVIDESTCFANDSRQTGMLVNPVPMRRSNNASGSSLSTEFMPKLSYIALLTGTPVRKDLTNLFWMCKVADGGAALGYDINAFRRTYQVMTGSIPVPTQRGTTLIPKWVDKKGGYEKAIEEIGKRFVVVRNLAKNLPGVKYVFADYTMPPETLEVYERVRRKGVLELPGGVLQRVAHQMAVRNKLLQIASGYVYSDGGGVSCLDKTRTDLILRAVKHYGKCLVLYGWTHQAEGLKQAFKEAGIETVEIRPGVSSDGRAAAIRAFQEGTAQVVLSHPLSCAHGITLTAGNAVIWAGISSPDVEMYMQANKRIWRRGQTKETAIVHFRAKVPLDRAMLQLIKHKSDRLTDFLDDVKDSLTDEAYLWRAIDVSNT